MAGNSIFVINIFHEKRPVLNAAFYMIKYELNGYHLMRLVESSTEQVEYSTRNSTLIQTSHFTCAELNALIMLNYFITHIISQIVLLNFAPFRGLLT